MHDRERRSCRNPAHDEALPLGHPKPSSAPRSCKCTCPTVQGLTLTAVILSDIRGSHTCVSQVYYERELFWKAVAQARRSKEAAQASKEAKIGRALQNAAEMGTKASIAADEFASAALAAYAKCKRRSLAAELRDRPKGWLVRTEYGLSASLEKTGLDLGGDLTGIGKKALAFSKKLEQKAIEHEVICLCGPYRHDLMSCANAEKVCYRELHEIGQV